MRQEQAAQGGLGGHAGEGVWEERLLGQVLRFCVFDLSAETAPTMVSFPSSQRAQQALWSMRVTLGCGNIECVYVQQAVPVAKLGALLIRTLAKPVVNIIKRQTAGGDSHRPPPGHPPPPICRSSHLHHMFI